MEHYQHTPGTHTLQLITSASSPGVLIFLPNAPRFLPITPWSRQLQQQLICVCSELTVHLCQCLVWNIDMIFFFLVLFLVLDTVQVTVLVSGCFLNIETECFYWQRFYILVKLLDVYWNMTQQQEKHCHVSRVLRVLIVISAKYIRRFLLLCLLYR